jgi:hypothetical protein
VGIFERNGKFVIDYYQQGQRRRETLPTKSLALKALSIRKAEIAQGKFGIVGAASAPALQCLCQSVPRTRFGAQEKSEERVLCDPNIDNVIWKTKTQRDLD